VIRRIISSAALERSDNVAGLRPRSTFYGLPFKRGYSVRGVRCGASSSGTATVDDAENQRRKR